MLCLKNSPIDAEVVVRIVDIPGISLHLRRIPCPSRVRASSVGCLPRAVDSVKLSPLVLTPFPLASLKGLDRASVCYTISWYASVCHKSYNMLHCATICYTVCHSMLQYATLYHNYAIQYATVCYRILQFDCFANPARSRPGNTCETSRAPESN